MRGAIALIAICAVAGSGCGGAHQPKQPAHGVPNIVGMEARAAMTLLHERGLAWRWATSPDVERELPPCWRQETCRSTMDSHRIQRQSPRPGSPITPKTVVVVEDECTLLRFKHNGEICTD